MQSIFGNLIAVIATIAQAFVAILIAIIYFALIAVAVVAGNIAYFKYLQRLL